MLNHVFESWQKDRFVILKTVDLGKLERWWVFLSFSVFGSFQRHQKTPQKTCCFCWCTSDQHNLQELQGPEYYIHLLDMHDRQGLPTGYGVTHLHMDRKLNTNMSVIHLLGGYWSLVNLWECTHIKLIELPPAGSCCASSPDGSEPPIATEVHAKCIAAWECCWISTVGWRRILGVSSPDILGSSHVYVIKSMVFAMGWKGKCEQVWNNPKTHKHQHLLE